MDTFQKGDGSRFIVDLGSIKLPTVLEKQVETQIRGVVLEALAGDNVSARRQLPSSIFDRSRAVPWESGWTRTTRSSATLGTPSGHSITRRSCGRS